MLRIKEVIKEKGLSVNEVAKKMGISQPSLSRAINNNTTVEMLQKIAIALDVSVAELFVGDSKKIQIILNNQLHTFYSIEELKSFVNEL